MRISIWIWIVILLTIIRVIVDVGLLDDWFFDDCYNFLNCIFEAGYTNMEQYYEHRTQLQIAENYISCFAPKTKLSSRWNY